MGTGGGALAFRSGLGDDAADAFGVGFDHPQQRDATGVGRRRPWSQSRTAAILSRNVSAKVSFDGRLARAAARVGAVRVVAP